MAIEYEVLTPEMREHFLEHGWVRIPQGMPEETVEYFLKNVWVRLGMDPNDKSTWKIDRPDRNDIVHMPKHRLREPKECAPKAWKAMCELLGGEQRVDTQNQYRGWAGWSDGLIVNIGTEYWEQHDIAPKELDNWHTDGDWFRHFLDSPEQALLVITLFSDVHSRGGATYVCEDGIAHVAKWLHDRPQGTNIWLKDDDGSRALDCIPNCSKFSEMTGKKGDVVLMHPLMPHSAAKNHLRNIRIISNPAVSASEPFNFNRADPSDYSLVELKTLRDLGAKSLPDWKITQPRERFRASTSTQAYKDILVQRELARLQEQAKKTGEKVDSVWLDNETTSKHEGLTADKLPPANAPIAAAPIAAAPLKVY